MHLKIPILTYHSLHAPGHDYHTNDHVALEADLELIRELGFTPISLQAVADWLNPASTCTLNQGHYIGISFDDGCDHDFYDFSYPGIPTLISFYNLLLSNNSKYADAPPLKATSFVIASPQARDILDKACIAGRDQWRDCWWKEADQSGIIQIANHSWDHTHPELDFVAQHTQTKGNFYCIDNRHDADMQILQAEWYIRHKLGNRSAGLFAYPYGHVNTFLSQQYFPNHADTFTGAFGTGGQYVTQSTDCWNIPRFVCGDHWNSPGELKVILQGALNS